MGKHAEKHPEKGKEKETKDQKDADRITELTADLQRLQAEFENFKKRNAREQAEYLRFSTHQVYAELLALLDAFDSALCHTQGEARAALEPLHKQFLGFLEKKGVHAFESDGKPYDHARHEVLLTESDPKKPDGVVTETLQKGYLFHDKVLRTAKVKINQLPDTEAENEKEKEREKSE